jgi:dipeptidyl-peptidase-4
MAFAQKDTLSLEDAILARWSKFAPERISGLQWVKNSNEFCYLEDNKLILENLDGNTREFSLTKLNIQFEGDSLSKFPRIHWMDGERFRFEKDSKFYIYHISNDNLTELLNFDESAQHSEFSDHALALAYTVDNNLFIQDSKGTTYQVTSDKNPNVINGQAVHRYEFGISKGTFWSNNGENLAFYRKDESMVTDYPLVNTDTRTAEANIIKYPMAGMTSHNVTVGIYNLESEKTVFIKTGEPKEQYLTNITWGPKDKYIYIAVLNRDQNHMKLNKYDAQTGEYVKTLFEEKHDNYVQPLHPMLFVKGNDNEFLWRSERDGYDHFYRYNVEGKLMNQVTKGEWVVKDFIAFDGNSIILTGTHNNALETQVYRSTIKAARSTMISKTEGIHRIKPNYNGRFLLDSYNSLTNPGTIELIDHTGNLLKTLLQAEDPFENTEIAQTELYTIKADDGTMLNCRMIKPSNFDKNKSYPVLVYVYNGPGVQLIYNTNLAGASLWMHHLANKENYIVFTVDGRGSENRGRDFEQAMFRNLGEVEMQDQIAGVEHLKSLDFIDADRLAVHGWSYGGFMTTNLMCSYPDVFTCGIAGGPVIDWKFYEVMYTERFMDTPQTNPEGYKNTSLINKAKNLKGDLLMIHGTQDDVVVWQHSLAFVQQCVEEGVQLDYFPYPGHPHNVRGKDRVHLMRKVIDYVIEHNQ